MNDTITTARALGETLDNCACDGCPAALVCIAQPSPECQLANAIRDGDATWQDYQDEREEAFAASRGWL